MLTENDKSILDFIPCGPQYPAKIFSAIKENVMDYLLAFEYVVAKESGSYKKYLISKLNELANENEGTAGLKYI